MAHDISGPSTGPSAVDPARASHDARRCGSAPADSSGGRRIASIGACGRPQAAVCHAARLLGRAGLGVPFLHAVAAAPERHRPGPGLRNHRGHRLRARSSGRVNLACLRRPGPPASAEPVLARLLRQRRRPVRGFLRARAVLAVRDPQAGRGHALQHPAGHRLAVRRGADLRPARGDRARRARRLPLGREPAQPLDRAARGEGDRLDPGGRPHLPGRHRPAAPGPCQRHEQHILTARHEDRGRRAAAGDQPAFGRPWLAHPVGHAGLAGPQLHRQGPHRG